MPERRGLSGVNASRVVLLPLLSVLDAERFDVEGLLREVGLSRQEMDDPELRLPRELVGDVWRAAVARTGNGALGLHVATQMQPGTLGLIEFAARNGASLGDALQTLARYGELLAEGVAFRVERDGARVRLTYSVTGSPQPPSVIDFALGYVARLMRDFTRPQVQLLEVSFDHPAPSDRRPFDALFRAPLRFDAKQNAMLLDAAHLSAQIQSADPHLRVVLEEQAKKLVSELSPSDTFQERVKRLIANELKAGDPSAQGLAKKLHMSARTFQRRLLEAGTTHTQLLDDVRHMLSLRLLGQKELSMGEIAAALGFSDVSAFRKAFKRWTGRAPKRADE